MARVKISLNGTDENWYHKMGLKMNPFPIIGRYEYAVADRILRELAADPIPDTSYIRQKLKGFAPAFVDECCRRFKKGERVEFYVVWPGEL